MKEYLHIVEDTKTFEEILIKGKESLVDFYKLFLCEKDEYKPPAQFHYQISDLLLNSKKHFAIEAFRESGKSSYALRAYPLYNILYPRQKKFYMLIIKSSATESARVIKQIAEEVRSNPLISFRVDRVVQETLNDGGAYELALKNNCKVRIEGKGKGSSVRGSLWVNKRPDIVLLDDPQDVSDMMSETMLEKDWEWFLSDILYLSKSGRLFLIGNNLGEKCIIERVIQNKEELGFEALRIPVLDDNGNPAWKEQYNAEEIKFKLDSAKKLNKLDVIMRELFCIALPDEYKTFKKEWFKYYNPEDKRNIKTLTNKYIVTDLAVSEKKTADYSVIMVVGVNPENHLFILDCAYGRFTPSEVIDKIFEFVQMYDVLKVGIEKVAYQAAFSHFLEKEMPRRNIFFEIVDLKADSQKEVRIKTLQPRFKTGTIWFEENADYLSELETELLSFPKGIHDDLIDALAYADQIVEVPVHMKSAVPVDEIGTWTAW
jgi:predicted phage terminase large subunit-like protein